MLEGSVTSTIDFNFNGIESGKDPLGNKFNVYDIKSIEIIKSAVESLGLEADVTDIKNSISISGNVPKNIINDITEGSSVIGDEQINVLNEIKDVSYNPTKYTLTFDYSNLGYSRVKGAKILNEIVKKYGEHFYTSYGYNSSIENAILALDYNDYDYTEAVDIMKSNLESLQQYVDYLVKSDNTRYVSEQTGYSFKDLSKAVQTLRAEDLEWISSYVISNNITKDKENLINYYSYKINNSEIQKESYQEQLTSLTSMIEQYKKTNTVVLGLNDDSEQSFSYSSSSETYDKLITMKIESQRNVSNITENIRYYEKRIQELEDKGVVNQNSERVEIYLADLKTDIDKILQDTNITATEYYQNVDLLDAYKITVEADDSINPYISAVIDSLHSIIAMECIFFAVYLFVSVLLVCLDIDITKKKEKKSKKGESENG